MGKDYAYRQSEAYREARHSYRQQPEVQARNQIKRAIKRHQMPVTVHFNPPTPYTGPKVKVK